MSETFFAIVDSYNQTTYPTNTMSVLLKDESRRTLRIDEEIELRRNAVYQFTVEPIEFKERQQYLVKDYVSIEDSDLSHHDKQDLMSCFYEYAPVDSETIEATIVAYKEKINNPIIKEIVDTIFESHKKAFFLYPAATKFHHAYIGGLAYHTATMLQLAKGMLDTYTMLNSDLLYAGVLLHDIFKVEELSHYAGPEYTKEGRLLGHISMGVKSIESLATSLGHNKTEEVLMLQHIILSHHYYGNYGSPKRPMIPEALILHFIDNIDSKMTVLQETLDVTEEGEFTSSIPVIDRLRFYKTKLKK